jgi:hypothetical protein
MDSTDYTTESTENSYSSPSEESVDHFPCQLFAHCQLTPIPLSDFSIPPPKTQKMRRQQQKQPSVLPSAFTNKSVFGVGRKRRREQGNHGIPQPPTKDIITDKEQKQTKTTSATKAKKEAQKETTSATKAKKEAQKESVVEFASTFKDKKKEQKQNVKRCRIC